ncbi:MAG: class I SAM-dependent methyltransferase [Nanoarchaeota archaeon]
MGEEVKYSPLEYAGTKQLPFRVDVEKHTIFTLAGDITGKRIFDAGCGDGIYARVSVDRGASHVLAVDSSRDFIDLARERNKGYEEKIDYHLAFMQDFFGNQDRDIAIGAYILSYPKNLEEAVAYCRAIASHLKEGGMFVGFNNNPKDVFDGIRFHKYGFEKEMHGGKEGGEVVYRVQGLTEPIINYFLKTSTYEKAFKEAGFSEFEWKAVSVSDQSQKSIFYWREFLKLGPPFIAMTAIK